MKRSWTRRWRPAFGLALVVLCAGLLAPPLATPNDVATGLPPGPLISPPERVLVESLVQLRRGDLEGADERLSSLVERQPDFRLAHLIRGDLWLARATGLTGFGQGVAHDEQLPDLLFEARARWSRYREGPPASGLPRALLRVPESAPSVLAVDLGLNRLYVFERAGERLEKKLDVYVSIGRNGSEKESEGDERTPVGLYLVSSYLAGETLPDLYGVGAFPINYPNAWDRLNGRTGSGIWIHGTESTTYSRPPRSSRGCVTLSNEDFQRLMDSVEIERTPVVVAERLEWASARQRLRSRRPVESQIENWRRAWESRDTEGYLDFYSGDFRTQGMNLEAFADHKRRVNRGKRYIKVSLQQLGLYAYPGEPDLVLADFIQHYESDSFRASSRKHQYWRRGPDGWRIVLEERV